MIETGFSITQLQNWMMSMLVQHVPVISAGDSGDLVVTDVVNSSKRLSAVKHLDIYRCSYMARLRACMKNQFSALAYALGDELFESYADQYLDAYPSESYTLNALGERFADFLEQNRPDAGKRQKKSWSDFIIELAEFEYALSELFDEKSHEPDKCDIKKLDNLLTLNPVLRLFNHRFAVCQYCLEFTRGMKPELPLPGESFSAAARNNYKLELFNITGGQYHFLKIMQQGKGVERAKEELVKNSYLSRADLNAIWPAWRKSFIASGFLY